MNRPGRTSVWPTRPIGTYPQTYVQIAKDDDEMIEISRFIIGGDDGVGLLFSRAEARLLAKRLNACLDETRKR